MTNEQMWGQDLTKVPGFEEATVKDLTNIRENGALAAYASCLKASKGFSIGRSGRRSRLMRAESADIDRLRSAPAHPPLIRP